MKKKNTDTTMKMKEMNQDVPIEAVLKYIVRDRDRYKSQLDNLIGYTKSLEIRVMEMTAEMNMMREEYAKNIEKARRERNAEFGAMKARLNPKRKKKYQALLNTISEAVKQLEARGDEIFG